MALVALNLSYVFTLTDATFGAFTDAVTVPYSQVQGMTQVQILTLLGPQVLARFAAWKNLLANPPTVPVVSLADQIVALTAQVAAEQQDLAGKQASLAALVAQQSGG